MREAEHPAPRLQKTHALGNGEEGGAALDALLLASGMPMSEVAEHEQGLAPANLAEQVEESSGRKTGSAHGRSMWTAEEDGLIEEGVRRFGCKWRQIATALPGRSDSSIRNRWMRLQREKADSRQAGAGGASLSPSAQPTGQSSGAGGLTAGGLALGQVEEEGEATLPWYQPRRSLSTGVAAPAPAACAGSAPRDRPPNAARVFGQATTAAARAPQQPQHAVAVALPWATSAGATTSVDIARQLSSSSDETGVSSTGHSPSAARTVHGVPPLAGPKVPFSAALRPSPLGGPTVPAGQGGPFSFGRVPAAPTAPTALTAPTAAPPLPLGYGAPLQGFDLGSFMHAVTCAVKPPCGPGAPTLERGSSNALNENDLHDLFEVCELGSAQLTARPTTSAPSEIVVGLTGRSPSPPQQPPPEDTERLAPPLCLRLTSSLLVAMSALAIGAALLPAADTDERGPDTARAELRLNACL